jgi:RNA polymerase sigma-70 factor (ECF subfamily)
LDAGLEAARGATDEELAIAIAEHGAEVACAEIFRRYQKKIYLWCFNYTHEVEEAVDCTQEIFIKIFENIAGFAGRSRFSTWVYSVVRNHCLTMLSRQRNRWRKRLVPLDDHDTANTTCVDIFHADDLAKDLERVLAAARERMEPEELQAFVLHYRDGMTVHEVTQVLGCENITGARTLIQNARRKFRRFSKWAPRDYQ